MTTATITFPDGSTATLVDEHPRNLYVSLFAHLRAQCGLWPGPILRSTLCAWLDGAELGEQNRIVYERLIQLDPGAHVDFEWDK